MIHVGDSYADLGATITAPESDKNLGLKYFLNGRLVSDIVIDTTHVTTDTVDYVATDPAGLTATSSRLIVIATAVPSSPPPLVAASSTPASISTAAVAGTTAQ